jgi:hypothetical protein
VVSYLGEIECEKAAIAEESWERGSKGGWWWCEFKLLAGVPMMVMPMQTFPGEIKLTGGMPSL